MKKIHSGKEAAVQDILLKYEIVKQWREKVFVVEHSLTVWNSGRASDLFGFDVSEMKVFRNNSCLIDGAGPVLLVLDAFEKRTRLTEILETNWRFWFGYIHLLRYWYRGLHHKMTLLWAMFRRLIMIMILGAGSRGQMHGIWSFFRSAWHLVGRWWLGVFMSLQFMNHKNYLPWNTRCYNEDGAEMPLTKMLDSKRSGPRHV